MWDGRNKNDRPMSLKLIDEEDNHIYRSKYKEKILKLTRELYDLPDWPC
jgi:hypothetical protein